METKIVKIKTVQEVSSEKISGNRFVARSYYEKVSLYLDDRFVGYGDYQLPFGEGMNLVIRNKYHCKDINHGGEIYTYGMSVEVVGHEVLVKEEEAAMAVLQELSSGNFFLVLFGSSRHGYLTDRWQEFDENPSIRGFFLNPGGFKKKASLDLSGWDQPAFPQHDDFKGDNRSQKYHRSLEEYFQRLGNNLANLAYSAR